MNPLITNDVIKTICGNILWEILYNWLVNFPDCLDCPSLQTYKYSTSHTLSHTEALEKCHIHDAHTDLYMYTICLKHTFNPDEHIISLYQIMPKVASYT